jgi:hypothetical protein
MREFEDAAGYRWAIDFTADPGAEDRVRRAVGACPVAAVASDRTLAAFLTGGMERLVDGVWAAVEPQARADRVTERQFMSRLDGPALFAAVAGLVVAAADVAPWWRTAEGCRHDFAKVFARLEDRHLADGKGVCWPFGGDQLRREYEEIKRQRGW